MCETSIASIGPSPLSFSKGVLLPISKASRKPFKVSKTNPDCSYLVRFMYLLYHPCILKPFSVISTKKDENEKEKNWVLVSVRVGWAFWDSGEACIVLCFDSAIWGE